jgi:hypothetical protein
MDFYAGCCASDRAFPYVLQHDLAATLRDNAACKLKVLDSLRDVVFAHSGAGRSEAEQPSPPFQLFPPRPPLTQAEAGVLALEWMQSMFDMQTDIGKSINISSFPFCTNPILRTAEDFQSAFSDRRNFGQAFNLYVAAADYVEPYLYKTEQRLANVPSYEMRFGKVAVWAMGAKIARSCIEQNIISSQDYVVEVHIWLPSVGKEAFFPVIIGAQDRKTKGFLGG